MWLIPPSFTLSYSPPQLIRVRIDQMSGPPYLLSCVCWWKTGAPALPAESDGVVCLSACGWVCVLEGTAAQRVKEGGALNSTGPPLLGVWVEFWHSVFCLFCFEHPPPSSTPHHHPPPRSLFYVSVGWWVCLFVWLQSDTASPPAYRHTDSEITSLWQRLRDGGGRGEGVRRDRCTDRALTAGGWVSLTHQSLAMCREASLL